MSEAAAVIPAPPRSPITFGPRGLQLLTFEDMFRFSKAVVVSNLAPKSYRTPEQVLIAIEWGAELGFGAMQSLTAFSVLNGVPRLNGESALALVLSSGLMVERHERFEGEGLRRCAVVALVRKGGLAVERRFTVEDAKRAGLESKENWRGYPDRMLFWRSMGYALHDLFADVLRGMRIAETMDDWPPAGEPMRDAEITPRALAAVAGPDPLLAQLETSAAEPLDLQVEDEPAAVPISEETRGDDRP